MSNAKFMSGSRALGLVCLFALSSPYIYNSVKQAYWTRRFRKLNMDEIISDRFTWLHHCMLRDEVERTLIQQASTTMKGNASDTL
ncbi:hypothetical protein X943_003067 [Babesia divergens]|uniref:Uncharacterized protein n=1 Tax=Babesia divergens TaxID=32595 RepID=A0AAD9GHQ2_BABDI|nr:hypothetical protein X943_003067 [Babesia divergens]